MHNLLNDNFCYSILPCLTRLKKWLKAIVKNFLHLYSDRKISNSMTKSIFYRYDLQIFIAVDKMGANTRCLRNIVLHSIVQLFPNEVSRYNLSQNLVENKITRLIEKTIGSRQNKNLFRYTWSVVK